MSEQQKDSKQLQELLSMNDASLLQKKLGTMQAADIADTFEEIGDEDVLLKLYNLLDDQMRSEVMLFFTKEIEEKLTGLLSDAELADIIKKMAPDDAADFLSEISDKTKFKSLLDHIDDDERKEILHLLSFDEESAGGIMTSECLPFPSTMRVETVIKMLRGMAELKDPIMFVYTIEPVTKKFLGPVSLLDLLKADPKTTLIELVDEDYVWTTVDADQEEIAKDFRRYNLLIMPVLDDQHRLVGRITADDILNVSIDEAGEDIAQMTGTPDLMDENVSPWNIIKLRLPWLLLTLLLALINSIVIESMLEKTGNVVALAIFLPVIMAMGGNTGMQSATIIIREMAMERLKPGDLASIIKRESFVGVVMGILCGLTGALIAYIFLRVNDVAIASLTEYELALIVFLSVVNAMTFSSFFGAIIPQILRKLNIDPAVAAGPFVTTMNDIISSVIYFITAYTLMYWFH